jgi:hypothetical protein
MEELKKEAKRDTALHCHISASSKKWLAAKAKAHNQKMGYIVNQLIENARSSGKEKE